MIIWREIGPYVTAIKNKSDPHRSVSDSYGVRFEPGEKKTGNLTLKVCLPHIIDTSYFFRNSENAPLKIINILKKIKSRVRNYYTVATWRWDNFNYMTSGWMPLLKIVLRKQLLLWCMKSVPSVNRVIYLDLITQFSPSSTQQGFLLTYTIKKMVRKMKKWQLDV